MKQSLLTTVMLALGAWMGMADVEVPSSLVLTEDADWRSQGKVTISSGVVIDLAGHSLKISDIAGEGVITNSSETVVSTLEVEVSAGNVVNDGVAWLGNLKLVKSGPGTLTMSKTAQTYTGGTDINAGKLQVANSAANAIDFHGRLSPVGAQSSTIRVSAGAVFNPGGNCNFNVYHIVLDGGTLANCADGFDMTYNTRESLSDIELAADSTFLGDYSMVFGQVAKTVLNGHMFTFSIANDKAVYWSTIKAENGTVRLVAPGNGRFETCLAAVDWSTVDVEVASALNLGATWTVRNYTANRALDGNAGNAEMRVLGIFRPMTDFFYGCTMQDGSTIDLSQKSGVWSTTSAFSGGRKVVTFADNAKVTLDLHGRPLTGGDQLIAWTSAPSNLNGLTFQPDAQTAAGGVSLAVNGAGVFVDGAGFVANAWWTGAVDSSVGNPANWVCRNGAGEVVVNGLPLSTTTLHFSGEINMSLGEGESLTSPLVEFDAGSKLVADVDWRSLTFGEMRGTLDLNGHDCRLSDLKGNTVFTSTRKSPCPYQYFRFDVRERVKGPHFEIGALALYAEDGTVQSSGITTDLTATSPTALAPGKCFTRDTFLGKKSHYGYKDAEKVDNLFNLDLRNKWCVGFLDGDATEVITVWFRLPTNAKPVVSYNLASSYGISTLQDRRPKAWTLWGSADGVNWKALDIRNNQNVTTANSTWFVNTPYVLDYYEPSQCSQLRVEVDEGRTLVNSTVAIIGGVRLVKEGAGTFTASKSGQSYAGGTEVAAGKLKMGVIGDVSILGAVYNDVTIDADAEVDINGNYNNTKYRYVFNGGTLAYHGGLSGSNQFIGDYEVVAEGSELAFANVNTIDANFKLNHHLLKVSVARLRGTTVVADEGTIDYHCRLYVTAGSFTATNATVIANAMHQFASPVKVGSYVEKSTQDFASSSAGSGEVFARFKPDTDFFYGVKLHDGVTIDFSDRTTCLPLASRCAYYNTLSFVDNATITLDLTGSAMLRPGRIISWTDAPANLSGLKFRYRADDAKLAYRVEVQSDGVYLISNGTMIFLR